MNNVQFRITPHATGGDYMMTVSTAMASFCATLSEDELFDLDRVVNLAIREHFDRKAEAIVESWQVPVAGNPKGGDAPSP